MNLSWTSLAQGANELNLKRCELVPREETDPVVRRADPVQPVFQCVPRNQLRVQYDGGS